MDAKHFAPTELDTCLMQLSYKHFAPTELRTFEHYSYY